MEKYANINARFIDILNILDMRQHVTVFGIGACGKQVVIFDDMPVYEVMTSLKEAEYRKLRNYEVTGINAGLVTNILIEKEGNNNG